MVPSQLSSQHRLTGASFPIPWTTVGAERQNEACEMLVSCFLKGGILRRLQPNIKYKEIHRTSQSQRGAKLSDGLYRPHKLERGGQDISGEGEAPMIQVSRKRSGKDLPGRFPPLRFLHPPRLKSGDVLKTTLKCGAK